MQDREFE